MKRVLLLISTVLCLAACEKRLPDSDAVLTADDFVGAYSYTDHAFVSWGTSSYTSALAGIITLTKITDDLVQMNGTWVTTGTVSGNTIQFNPCPQSYADGYCNYTFGMATLSGNTLSFTYVGYGQRSFNGTTGLWTINGSVAAVK